MVSRDHFKERKVGKERIRSYVVQLFSPSVPRGCCLLGVDAQLVWVEPEEAEGPVSSATVETATPPVNQSVIQEATT